MDDEERQATTLRLTRSQLKWIKDQAFDRRMTQQAVVEAAVEMAMRPGRGRAAAVTPCPVCSEPSHYAASMDRYVHVSGDPNHTCWAKLTREGSGS